ncbi:MAG: phosphoribosylglycinamide formyltransferase, partial [Proteobacteria bacterium]|nr:phosphoribosylglycinamide formyltransferase [Pseudomonadota bacterium]
MKMAVLLSGSGRTLDNFHERIAATTMQGSIEVVISSVVDALGLDKARKYGYPAFHAKDNDAINGILQEHNIE